MKKSILAFIVLLSFAPGVKAQNLNAFIKNKLDTYITENMKAWEIPGLALCIIKNGEVILIKGYGTKTIGAHDAVDTNTLFMIGSNTKAFTGTALALLDYEKKLSLDDKVTKWIPDFRLENQAAGEQAIIRDLLCHRLGFQTFQGDFTYWTSNLTRKEVIEKMGHIKAQYPFRTRYGYTNAGFLTAGEIIPVAAGMPWEDFIRQRIFKPLGMTRTLALSKEMLNAENKALPHTLSNGKMITIPISDIDNLGPAGSISSSVTDLSKWVIMQLNKGKLKGKEVIPQAVVEEIRKPHTIVGGGKPSFNEGHFGLYGLGFFLQEYQGREIISHTGGVNGFVTGITMSPEDKLGIIVLTNNDQNGFFEALKWEILDASLGLPFRNYGKVYLTDYKTQKASSDREHRLKSDTVAMHLTPTLPLTAYAGSYTNEVYGKMDVVLAADGLRMNFSHHPNMYAKLESLGGNRFYAVFTDPEFSHAVFPFKIGNQQVTGVTVKVADFIEYNPYEFSKIN